MKRATDVGFRFETRGIRVQNFFRLFPGRDVDDHADHSRLADRRSVQRHLVMQPHRASVGRDGPEFELVRAGLPCTGPSLDDVLPVVGVNATDPEIRLIHPSVRREPEDLFGTTTDKREARLVEFGFAEDRSQLFDEITVTLLRRGDGFAQKDRLRLFAIGDVKGNALKK